MTEEEAKQKWCPMVRLGNAYAPDGDSVSWDNRGNGYHETNCIGSECMAWRLAHADSHSTGSCGLVGRP